MRTLLPPTNGAMHAEMIQKQENLRNFVDKRTHGKTKRVSTQPQPNPANAALLANGGIAVEA